MDFKLRQAALSDVDLISKLIDASVRGLARGIYSDEQIERSIGSVFGVDRVLIADGTYFVAEFGGEIIGCGGWSKRTTLFGASEYGGSRNDSLLNPATDAARIRAFFVHPKAARKGVGTAILTLCESEASANGFRRTEMMATLPGVPMYLARGYRKQEEVRVALDNEVENIVCIRMTKDLDLADLT